MTSRSNHEVVVERAVVYLRDRVAERERFQVDPLETAAWMELIAMVVSSAQLLGACRMVAIDMKMKGVVSRHSINLCERAVMRFEEAHEAEKNR